jgi:hypothetical protein
VCEDAIMKCTECCYKIWGRGEREREHNRGGKSDSSKIHSCVRCQQWIDTRKERQEYKTGPVQRQVLAGVGEGLEKEKMGEYVQCT